MDWGTKAVISSAVASLVTVAVSLALNVFGGRAAAVIGTMPHVAVVGSIGFYAVLELRDFEVAVLSMCVGIFLNGVYVATMASVSKMLDAYWKARSPRAIRLRPLLVVGCGFAVFAACVALVLGVLRLKEGSPTYVRACAVAAFALQALLGLLLVCSVPSAAKKKTRSSLGMVAARACITFGIFFVAMYVARTMPSLSGILVNMPIVTTVVFLSIWQSQGEAVATSTGGPMTLGMLSANAYSLLACELMPLWGAGGAALAWLACVAGITLPLLGVLELWERRRGGPLPKGAESEPEASAESEPVSAGGITLDLDVQKVAGA